MIIPSLSITDATVPGVHLSAEVTTDGQVMLWVRDESIGVAPVAAGILLDGIEEQDLRDWLERVRAR